MKALVIGCGHRITRGSDIAVMHQQMLRTEVAVQCHGHQHISHLPLQPGFLVHQFMGIVDPDGAGNNTNTEHHADFCRRAEMTRVGDNPYAEQHHNQLDRGPSNCN